MKVSELVSTLTLEQTRLFYFIIADFAVKYGILPDRKQVMSFVNYLKQTTECEDRYIGTQAQPLYCLEIEGCMIDGEDSSWVCKNYIKDHKKNLMNILVD